MNKYAEYGYTYRIVDTSFIRRVAGGEETLFRGMVRNIVYFGKSFVSKDILKILCRSCMLWMQKRLSVSF